MIVKDEENYLEQCLSSAKGLADEIIIVDTGSKDKTKEIAKKFNAKVFDFKWNDDFSAARNESLKHATKDWILVLDADESLSKESVVPRGRVPFMGDVSIHRSRTRKKRSGELLMICHDFPSKKAPKGLGES